MTTRRSNYEQIVSVFRSPILKLFIFPGKINLLKIILDSLLPLELYTSVPNVTVSIVRRFGGANFFSKGGRYQRRTEAMICIGWGLSRYNSDANHNLSKQHNQVLGGAGMIFRRNIFGNIALCINHLAGFVDLVIIPIWVGVLVQHYKNNPQQAGAVVSLFLVGQVLASIILSPKFDRIKKKRQIAAVGYLLAAACMFFMVQTTTFPVMALLHFIAGLSVGVGLSITEGTIGHSENPHRLFAIASLSLGTFAILFYIFINPVIISHGGHILFYFITILMFVSFLSTLFAFPSYEKTDRKLKYEAKMVEDGGRHAKIPVMVWFVIAGLMGMAMITAMASSFFERYGIASGYSPEKVNMILLINGIILLTPSICAAFLQKYLKVRTVAIGGIIFQALVVILIYTSNSFLMYASPAWGIGFAAIFVHTFLFGYLAHMDPSGRVVAANPAVMMTGSMLGPFIGGTLVQYFGFQSIAIFVAVWNALILFICFWRIKEVELSPSIVTAPGLVTSDPEKVP